MKSAILVMAAGLSRRFKQAGAGHKLVATLDGKTVLQHTLEQARATERDVYVVSQPADVQIHRLSGQASLVLCASDGLGDSIAAGVRACKQYDGWLIALGDMPWLTTGSYLAVLEALESYPVVRPVFAEVPGHPVGFQSSFYTALTALRGDNGAKAILQLNPPHMLRLQDRGCLLDVDYPEALSGSAQ